MTPAKKANGSYINVLLDVGCKVLILFRHKVIIFVVGRHSRHGDVDNPASIDIKRVGQAVSATLQSELHHLTKKNISIDISVSQFTLTHRESFPH